MEIKRYSLIYEKSLFELLKSEGKSWESYHGEKSANSYKIALNSSITYIALENNIVCGYVRCRDDDGFGIYVYDLLVDKKHRGNKYGYKLLEYVYNAFPNSAVYVMSDVDKYYIKQGFKREGSIFIVSKK